MLWKDHIQSVSFQKNLLGKTRGQNDLKKIENTILPSNIAFLWNGENFIPISLGDGMGILVSHIALLIYGSCLLNARVFRINSRLIFFFFNIFKQLAAYITFAANSAAFEAAFLAVTGANELQWMKLCNRFTRFCIQIGGALICGFLSSLLMAVISSISAFNLFRLYSPKRLLLFKQTWWSILSLICL